jgi:hypothetical protein
MEIQFSGIARITQSCVNAVLRYLQFGDQISKALIVTNQQSHALILYTEDHEIIAIKSGFASGYPGEGPKGFAYILSLLDMQEIEIEEYDVKKKVIEKINCSRLTKLELEKIKNSRPVRPTRWHDYVYEYRDMYSKKEHLLIRFPHVIPFSIIDPRLFDLSVSFWDAPGDKILAGYRRLEDVIRERCNLDDHGSRLFQKAFLGDKAELFWPGLNSGETAGRANLFIATYGGFRNRRAHKEIEEFPKSQLMEFLALNQLFILESASKLRTKEGEQRASLDTEG